LIEELERDGFVVKIKKVPYEIQRGGNQMLWVFKKPPHRKLLI